MILDTLDQSKKYNGLHPLFSKAFEFLHETNFEELALGKHELVKDQLFAIFMEYDTKESTDGTLEAHKKFIDIQAVIAGQEVMEVSKLGIHATTKPYNPENDLEFFEGEGQTKLLVDEGQFAVFFPEDVHKPNIKVDHPQIVKKVVMKVLVNC